MSLLLPGLVSVSFRKLSTREVVDLAVRGGARTLEWGGDVHVPAGDLAVAREVRRCGEDAGLACAAYGSYYRLGQGMDFGPVLASAVALGAATIRVWPGIKGSKETDAGEWQAVVDDARRIASLAAAEKMGVSLEYHANTLTDTRDSVRKLAEELKDGPDFLWQPANGAPADECEERLREILPRVRHVHVFHWWPTAQDRRPLAEGEASWKRYLKILRPLDRAMPCLLEFVRDDSPEQFLEDAATLRRWLE
jgi:3-dehydroshikimate dehydratase